MNTFATSTMKGNTLYKSLGLCACLVFGLISSGAAHSQTTQQFVEEVRANSVDFRAEIQAGQNNLYRWDIRMRPVLQRLHTHLRLVNQQGDLGPSNESADGLAHAFREAVNTFLEAQRADQRHIEDIIQRLPGNVVAANTAPYRVPARLARDEAYDAVGGIGITAGAALAAVALGDAKGAIAQGGRALAILTAFYGGTRTVDRLWREIVDRRESDPRESELARRLVGIGEGVAALGAVFVHGRTFLSRGERAGSIGPLQREIMANDWNRVYTGNQVATGPQVIESYVNEEINNDSQ